MAILRLRPFLLVLAAVSLFLASPPAGAASRDDEHYAFDLRSGSSSDFLILNSSFLISQPGPQWFRNALSNSAASRLARTNVVAYDSSDDRLEAPWIGTNADTFSPMSFSSPLFVRGSGSQQLAGSSILSVDGPAAWSPTPINGDWNNDANWSPASPNGPSSLALFGASNTTHLTLTSSVEVADIIFGSTAGAYTITVPANLALDISGSGVTNNSSALQNFVVRASPTAGGLLEFLTSANAGNDRVTYAVNSSGGAGSLLFFNNATAGTANFIANAGSVASGPGSLIQFFDTSSADHGIITLNGSGFGNPTGLGGSMDFGMTSTAGAATLIANGGAGFTGTGGEIRFDGDSTGGTARVEVFGNGDLNLASHNTPASGPAVTIGSLEGTGFVFLGGRTLGIGSNNQSTTFSGTITGTPGGGTTGGVTKVGTGTLLLAGPNNYIGATTIAGGELFLTSSGSLLSASQIRLGDTVANSPSAMFTFGSNTGGINLSNAMTVQASASGTEGRRTLLALATTGTTNTYSGNITMNTDLTVQSAAVGSTPANGQGILTLSGTIDVRDNTFEMNSNLRGNNADTYSIQGIVRVTGPLTSSLAAGGSVIKDGSGTLILENANNSYTGTDANMLNSGGTRIRGGVLGIVSDTSLGLAPGNIFGTNNVFFESSAYNTNPDSIAPTLRAYADNIVISGTRFISLASNVNAQFDSNGYTFTIDGSIGGAGNFRKLGAGSVVLTSANFFSGTTTINQGTLNAGYTFSLGGTSHVTVNSGGTLLLSNNTNDRINNNAGMTLNANGSPTVAFNTAGLSEEVGALTLQSSSIVDLANGASILSFANSALQAGSWNGTLSIYNWSGTLLTGNGTDQLFFGTDPTGLAPSQLVQISFYSDNGMTFLGVGSWATDLDGEVVPLAPIPEPSTWIGAALALAAVGIAQRKKLRGAIGRRA